MRYGLLLSNELASHVILLLLLLLLLLVHSSNSLMCHLAILQRLALSIIFSRSRA